MAIRHENLKGFVPSLAWGRVRLKTVMSRGNDGNGREAWWRDSLALVAVDRAGTWRGELTVPNSDFFLILSVK